MKASDVNKQGQISKTFFLLQLGPLSLKGEVRKPNCSYESLYDITIILIFCS